MSSKLKMHLVFIILLTMCVGIGWYVAQPKVHSYVYSSVCDLVNDKIYIQSEKLTAWHKSCKQEAKEGWFLFSRKEFLIQLQKKLNQLKQSHLYLLMPAEVKRRKTGVFKGTGLQARWVEDKLIITKVIKNSVSEKLGVQRGFELVSVNSEPVNAVEAVAYLAGRYVFIDHKFETAKTIELEIRPQKLQEAIKPELRALDKKTVYLKIPSFYQHNFNQKNLTQISDKINKMENVIIDFRGNVGGSLIQSVRLLSMFTCKKNQIGSMVRPREKTTQVLTLEDSMNFATQYMQLKISKEMQVQTFPNYGCFKGKVYVLIDESTGSSAEIFAQAIIDLKRGVVLGKPSAGEVLMAFEYDLEELGDNYSLLIPEASYKTINNKDLEGRGVQPDSFLAYDLKIEQQSRDSWVAQALQAIP